MTRGNHGYGADSCRQNQNFPVDVTPALRETCRRLSCDSYCTLCACPFLRSWYSQHRSCDWRSARSVLSVFWLRCSMSSSHPCHTRHSGLCWGSRWGAACRSFCTSDCCASSLSTHDRRDRRRRGTTVEVSARFPKTWTAMPVRHSGICRKLARNSDRHACSYKARYVSGGFSPLGIRAKGHEHGHREARPRTRITIARLPFRCR